MTKKLLSLLVLTVMLAANLPAQTTFRAPTVRSSNSTTGISWNAGTVNNGGHPVSVSAGSSTISLNKTDCAAPAYATCNIVYANSSGTVAVTATLATAIAAGNTILAFIESGATTITQVVYPLQNGALWTSGAAVAGSTITAPIITTGLTASGSAANDFSGSTDAFKTSTGANTFGGSSNAMTAALAIAATTNQLALGTTNVTTLSAASPAGSATVTVGTTTVSIATAYSCGTTATCAAAAGVANTKEVWGSVALSSASPSIATVTVLPFTSNTSYFCTASPEGTTAAIAAAGIAVSRTNGTTLVLTGPNTVTTVIHYHCWGT